MRKGLMVEERRIEIGAVVTALGRLEADRGGSRRRLAAPSQWYQPNVIATPDAARLHRTMHGILAAPFVLGGLWMLVVQTTRAVSRHFRELRGDRSKIVRLGLGHRHQNVVVPAVAAAQGSDQRQTSQPSRRQ